MQTTLLEISYTRTLSTSQFKDYKNINIFNPCLSPNQLRDCPTTLPFLFAANCKLHCWWLEPSSTKWIGTIKLMVWLMTIKMKVLMMTTAKMIPINLMMTMMMMMTMIYICVFNADAHSVCHEKWKVMMMTTMMIALMTMTRVVSCNPSGNDSAQLIWESGQLISPPADCQLSYSTFCCFEQNYNIKI